jgi:hypothetical protein
MKYYSKYLIDLCVPWSDESEFLFERSAKGFCKLLNTWNRKSASFIERQRFRFLSNFMSKGNRSNHNKIAATAWRQRHADWWSEMKKAKQNLAKSTTPINQTTNLNDEAAGRLSHSDLHHIITAALEGKQKQQHAYRALANNYASLMKSFKMKFYSE